MKKILLSLLTAVLLSAFFTASAENRQPVFQLSGGTVKCGEEITVSVSLNDNAAVSSFMLDITYDKAMLRPVRVGKTELLSGQMISNLQYRENALRVVYASDRDINATGEILRLTFKAVDYQKGGTDTELVGLIASLGNQALETVGGTVKNARLSIAENPDYTENEEKRLTISSVTCNAGEEAVVVISTPDILDVCSGSLTVCYDPGLQVLQCEKGELFSDQNVLLNPESEKNRIRMNFMGVTPISKAGDLVRLKLSARSNETKSYRVYLEDVEFFRLDESFVPISANSGVVEAAEVKTADPGSRGGSAGPAEKPEIKAETPAALWRNPFTDIRETDWFYENVRYVIENGLMNGVADDEFAPNAPLTRAMLVTVLYRSALEPTVERSSPFADVSANTWYTDAVIWAKQNGIVNGVSETAFAPNANITREQIAAIMHRYARYRGGDTDAGEGTDIQAYTDAGSVSEYALASMRYAVGSGLLRGKTGALLAPLESATRAEIAAIFQRFLER